MSQILVTGGSGFIGSNFVRRVLASKPDLRVVNLDKLTYAGNPENLRDLERDARYRFVQGDVAEPKDVERAMEGCQAVVHFAAESHVDRSIRSAAEFLRTNVLGTHALLESARGHKVERFVHISTDEVYGSLAEGAADEESPMVPNSPYAASKAAGDHLVRAYAVTHGVPAVVIRGSNNYGPYQFPEKFLPLLITNALEDEPLPIYGDGRYVREWLYVEDFCEAIDLLWEQGAPGEVYNVGSGDHRVNLEVAQTILDRMGKPRQLLRHVTDRPGHDRRYAITSEKTRTLGWRPRHRFEEGLEKTIAWYREHEEWWQPLKEKQRKAEGCRVTGG